MLELPSPIGSLIRLTARTAIQNTRYVIHTYHIVDSAQGMYSGLIRLLTISIIVMHTEAWG